MASSDRGATAVARASRVARRRDFTNPSAGTEVVRPPITLALMPHPSKTQAPVARQQLRRCAADPAPRAPAVGLPSDAPRGVQAPSSRLISHPHRLSAQERQRRAEQVGREERCASSRPRPPRTPRRRRADPPSHHPVHTLRAGGAGKGNWGKAGDMPASALDFNDPNFDPDEMTAGVVLEASEQ